MGVTTATRFNGTMALVVTKTTLGSKSDDAVYWRGSMMVDRVAAVEILRQRTIGGEGATRSGLQRVCRIVHC